MFNDIYTRQEHEALFDEKYGQELGLLARAAHFPNRFAHLQGAIYLDTRTGAEINIAEVPKRFTQAYSAKLQTIPASEHARFQSEFISELKRIAH